MSDQLPAVPVKRGRGRPPFKHPRIVNVRGVDVVVGDTTGHARKVTEGDVKEICELCVKGLNEREASALAGVNSDTWKAWKCRNKEKFEHLFTKIRAARIKNLLGEIETAAKGDSDKGIRHDWRAARELLALGTPERFSARATDGQASAQPTINVAILSELSRQIFKTEPVSDNVTYFDPVKALPAQSS